MARFAVETDRTFSTKSKRLVAQSRDDLYAAPSLKPGYTIDLENGWWLGIYISIAVMEGFIETACQVAGVKYGSELTLIRR